MPRASEDPAAGEVEGVAVVRRFVVAAMRRFATGAPGGFVPVARHGHAAADGKAVSQ